MKNLIIVPVGSHVDKFTKLNNLDFDLKSHWRNRLNNRNYLILAVQYSDYIPENDTYDELVVMKGYKWEIIKKLSKIYDFSMYEYIGLYDDDVVIDYISINNTFIAAKNEQINAFQVSLAKGSESAWPCTRNVSNWYSATTNFIEIMCPVFNIKSLMKIINLLNLYEPKHGWGIDIILADYLGCELTVYHFCSMYHPSRPETGSTYSAMEARIEMQYLLSKIYSRINPNFRFTHDKVTSHKLIEQTP